MNQPSDDVDPIVWVNGFNLTNGVQEMGLPVDCYGYSWVDFQVTLSNPAGGAAKFYASPVVRMSSSGTPSRLNVEEGAAGTGNRVQYPYVLEFPTGIADQVVSFRVPRIQRFVSVYGWLDVGTASAVVRYMRRSFGA